jgi:Tfp pilus assembly protein PilF
MKETKWLAPALAGVFGIGALVLILKLVVAPSAPTIPSGPAPQGIVPQTKMNAELAREIDVLRQVVARDPKNGEAWTQLGNNLFDSNRPTESIEAYARALEITPNNPNILTDQGVMYRAIGQFDKAIANFRKAIAINPRHTIARFNWGVVLYNDLRDLKGAKEVFLQYEAMGGGEHSVNVRGLLGEIEKETAAHGTAPK